MFKLSFKLFNSYKIPLIIYHSVCESRIDLALVVDGSSITTRSDRMDWARILDFLQEFVSKFHLGSGRARVAAVVFGDVGEVIFSLDSYTTRVSGLRHLEMTQDYR